MSSPETPMDSASASKQPQSTTVKPAEAPDDSLTRRVLNDYEKYRPICIEPGREGMRLMHIVPAKDEDDDDEEIVCILFDVPMNTKTQYIYVALSYCWGDMTELRTISLIHQYENDNSRDTTALQEKWKDSKIPGQSSQLSTDIRDRETFSVTKNLHDALRSIRRAAPQIKKQNPELDYQTVWIDAICINQGNFSERNVQVSSMGTIYSRAWFVWVWLGESGDVMQGLVVVQAMIRYCEAMWESEFNARDPDEKHIRGLFTAEFKLGDEPLGPEGVYQILERLFANPYFKRIWVLQEATVLAERTYIHVALGRIPWTWIIVADRFRKAWRRRFPTGQTGSLPLIWGDLIHRRFAFVKDFIARTDRYPKRDDGLGFSAPLYSLFVNTFEDFDSTDPRDKLFALLDLSEEAQGKNKVLAGLEPDYNKTVCQVYTNFTRWCIRHGGNLDILSIVCGGPRRLLPSSKMIELHGGRIPAGCLDARKHPSWAIWPISGGYWSEKSSIKARNSDGEEFDLALKHKVVLHDLTDDPSIKVAPEVLENLISLGGRRIATVKSILRLPIRLVTRERTQKSSIQRKWPSEEMRKDMKDYDKSNILSLTHPFREHSELDGGLARIWHHISSEELSSVDVGDETLELGSQECLGREGGRYHGRQEQMFRDLIETLLLSPVYRGKEEGVTGDEVRDGLPPGPWDDPELAKSFAFTWAETDSPMRWAPPRVGEFLRKALADETVLGKMGFAVMFQGYGKCLFITEDEHMGLCSVEAQAGDVVVGLYGSRVPFVLHPIDRSLETDRTSWTFEGDDELRKSLFRFVGECYLHERMTSSFFEDEEGRLGGPEVFHLY